MDKYRDNDYEYSIDSDGRYVAEANNQIAKEDATLSKIWGFSFVPTFFISCAFLYNGIQDVKKLENSPELKAEIQTNAVMNVIYGKSRERQR